MRIMILGLVTLLLCACSNSPQAVQRTEKKLLLLAPAEELLDQPEVQAFRDASVKQGVAVEVSTDPSWLQEERLQDFSALALLNWEAEALNPRQQADIERYLQAGNGLLLLGTHLQTTYTWPWLGRILKGQTGGQDKSIQAVKDTPTEAEVSYQEFQGGRLVLANSLSPDGTGNQPAFWSQSLTYAIGDNRYDLSQAQTHRAPKGNRFTRLVLDENDVYEPMELAVLPDGKVLFIERRGRMKLYFPETEQTKTIANFDVCLEGNYEDGLLGLALDPKFAENQYLYLYYSPSSVCDRPQTLSRFKLRGDSLIMASEVVVLEVPVQRETCCHSGGSVTFGADGYLYLSTGDNTSSKESNGYSPLDERPGRGPFDAQKSSGNPADLRGKILRIEVTSFGKYRIPDGNLFPKDGSQGAPEIYVMGARNPFRIAVDSKTSYVYWGDVGPDVGVDGKYGPQSFDEWNQARSAGNYGWPYFVGNNLAYRYRDFEMDTVGAYYDPAKPINRSPNNTGKAELPPARPAFIWYAKGTSEQFPMLGRGSNSAMAGPILHRDEFPQDSKVRFPEYYDGKWFIYEWARSWIQVVSFDEKGDLARIEPFLPDMPLSKPIDMEFGPDGAMYILEYGQNYFVNNPDAKLVRLEYAASNRLPIPRLSLDQAEGAAPHEVHFSAEGSFDYDENDTSLQFVWSFTETGKEEATGKEVSFTFSEVGVYHPILTVIDAQGGQSIVRTEVRVGNEPPRIQLTYAGNESFYFAGESHPYEFSILDPEDQANGGIRSVQTQVHAVYVGEGYDADVLLGGTEVPSPSLRFLTGKNLIENSDCSSCHAMKKRSVGPSYLEVAERYEGDPEAETFLSEKIISGGNGNWGEKIMAGHPQHSLEETREMARYILALAADKRQGKLPLRGILSTDQQAQETGAYLLAATYTDQGANDISPLTTRKRLLLRHPRVQAENWNLREGFQEGTVGANRETVVMRGRGAGKYLGMKAVDLTGLAAMQLRIGLWQGGVMSLRIDSPDGEILSQVNLPAGQGREDWRTFRFDWPPVAGKHDLYLVIEASAEENPAPGQLDWMEFEQGKGS